MTVPVKVLQEWADRGMPLPEANFSYKSSGTDISYEELDLNQSWQHFNIEHELTTKGIQKFVKDYRSTLRQAS